MKAIARVWKFSSSSNPDKSYETLQYEDGTTSCQCPGWTRRVAADGSRTCKHTRSVDMGTADTECTSSAVYGAVGSVPVKMQQPVQKMHEPSLVGAFKRKILWDSPAQPETPKPSELILPQLLNPINDDQVDKYLNDNAWVGQEKKDGRHQIIRVVNGVMTVYNRKGKEIGFPSSWTECITVKNILLDGEAIDDQFHAFDLLEVNGEDLRTKGYSVRYVQLAKLFKNNELKDCVKLVPAAWTASEKKALYEQLKWDKKEGIVFKKIAASYIPGRPNELGNMLKMKFYATLTARVKQGRKGKHSIGLELLDGATWIDVGNCTVGQATSLPEIGTLVEIRFLYYFKGGSLYQPTYLGPRNDLEDSDCVLSQVKYKAKE